MKLTKKAAAELAALIDQYANFSKISKIKERELIAAEKANDGVAMDAAKAGHYTADRVAYQCAITLHDKYGIELDILSIAQRHLAFVQKQERFYHARVEAAKANAANDILSIAQRHLAFVQKQERFYHARVEAAKANAANDA